ncbi:MAG: hypothetical protein ACXV3F_13220 [Frankiaceae bacterium]
MTAWQIYRLQTHRPWLDHLISDRFCSREELDRSVRCYFPAPGCEIQCGSRRIGLVWDNTRE